jgi:hypothetical protein
MCRFLFREETFPASKSESWWNNGETEAVISSVITSTWKLARLPAR